MLTEDRSNLLSTLPCRCNLLRTARIELLERPNSEAAFINAFCILLQSKPFRQITVSDIINKSGYSRGIFYRNYQDMTDFITRFLQQEARVYAMVLYHVLREQDPDWERQGNLILEYFRYVLANNALYHSILDSQIPDFTFQDFSKMAAENCKSFLTQRKSFGPNQELSCFILSYNLFGCVVFWDINGYTFTPEEMAEQLTQIIQDRFDLWHQEAPSPSCLMIS